MDTPGNNAICDSNFVDQLKKKSEKIMEICNILQHYGVPDIYFMSKEDIKTFIFDEEKIEKEIHTPKTSVGFNKPTKKPKLN
jgi:dissimilatory sulfite reductase (desulfoviridin) alpha/beta subunit